MDGIIQFVSKNFIFESLPGYYLYSSFILFCLFFLYFLYRDKKNLNLLFFIPLIISFYSGLSYAFRFTFVHKTAELYWDVTGLHCANLAIDSGLSPYNGMAECMYPNLPMLIAYQPIFLNFFWEIELSTMKILWLLISFVSFYIIYFYSKQILEFKSNIFFFFLFLFGAYQGASWVTIQSGNIAIITYAISFYFLYRLIKQNKKLGFFIVIGLLTAFKYHFIFLLLYPIFIDKKIEFKYHLLSFVVFAFVSLLSYHLYSNLYGELFSKVIGMQIDLGLGPYPSQLPIYNYFQNSISGLEFNTLFKGFIFLILFLIFFKKIRKDDNYSKIDLFILATLIVNICIPRLKLYDLLLIIPCTLKLIEDCVNSRTKVLLCNSIILVVATSFFFKAPQWWWINDAYYYIIILFLFFIYQRNFFRLKDKN